MAKTPIQKLINGKPSDFARRIGCPKSTANHYSDGARTPPEWVYRLIKDKIISRSVTIDFANTCQDILGATFNSVEEYNNLINAEIETNNATPAIARATVILRAIIEKQDSEK